MFFPVVICNKFELLTFPR